MSAAQAILEQNTHSQTLMDALPALHRAAVADEAEKGIFLFMLKYWLTFKKQRTPEIKPHVRTLLQFLAHAQRLAVDQKERDAIEVITVSWEYFGPTEWMLGCT